MNAIYKFYVDYGRHGDLSGVFVAEQADVKNLIGKEIYFGEVLGKHSEVFLQLKEEHLTEVTTDEKFIELFDKYDLSNGYNPFDYYEENEEDEG